MYLQMESFQGSEPYRGQGIGKALFAKACVEVKELVAKNCIFPQILQRNLKRLTELWDVYMHWKSFHGLPIKSRVMRKWSMHYEFQNNEEKMPCRL